MASDCGEAENSGGAGSDADVDFSAEQASFGLQRARGTKSACVQRRRS